MLMHLSKSGGTSMCQWAERAGCHDPVYAERPGLVRGGEFGGIEVMGHNCWSRTLEDGPIWLPKPGSLPQMRGKLAVMAAAHRRAGAATCAGRESFLRSHGLDFFAVEAPAWGELARSPAACLARFHSVILLRDPLERLHSHLCFLDTNRRYGRDWAFGATLPKLPDRDDGLLRFNLTAVVERLPHLTNNYVTRTLAGAAAYAAALGDVGRAEHEAARTVLRSFE